MAESLQWSNETGEYNVDGIWVSNNFDRMVPVCLAQSRNSITAFWR
jgi:hypothetical protein